MCFIIIVMRLQFADFRYEKEKEMKSITRKVDNLGRIVLPIDMRKAMGIGAFSEIVMALDNGALVIKRREKRCKLCSGEGSLHDDFEICSVCIEKVRKL